MKLGTNAQISWFRLEISKFDVHYNILYYGIFSKRAKVLNRKCWGYVIGANAIIMLKTSIK